MHQVLACPACPNRQNMHPCWHFSMFCSTVANCNAYTPCVPKEVAVRNHTQNTWDCEHPTPADHPIKRQREAALSTSRQVRRASGGPNLSPIGTFEHSAGAAQRLMVISMGHVCADSCLSKYLKMVYFGPTSSCDDAAIIHHQRFW